MALHCPSGMSQSTLVKKYHHNLQTALLTQIRVADAALGSSWYNKASRQRKSPRSRLKKKTTNQDPTN